ncbi:trans-aconitate methyltransferase [Haematobacter missouriensis]|uniref:Trans-aconitate methyltransferase n=1 Tax=Haematobacter missouriensis TaxID=366616 RepID=A0A212AUC8_9RHOB|nr:methyltransferase domain-containing protein [Haematobacter missouriensis]OWJ79504.1 trans-aconitate methyltransferase [Haematobacter missouriensis]OWJ85016.1 trans-aconitate methyltransferase [Haematobacter missouriensis]
MAVNDWNPELYHRFADLRLRPALDLMAQVPRLPEGDVIDLGCGSGAAGPALAARFPGRRIVGVDSSPAMLAKAAEAGIYADLIEADAATWRPDTPPALIFSNALLQWLPDHDTLMPHLVALLEPYGVLAVQMPRQEAAPSHRLIREVAAALYPDRFCDPDAFRTTLRPATGYVRLLEPEGEINAWETEYVQRLQHSAEGHPVRLFTSSTAMRPVLDRLTAAEQADFIAAYESAISPSYPQEPDGTVLFPFLRLFFVLRRGIL